MKGFTLAAAATALFATANAAIDPIVIKGSKFFYKTNGTQFFMKGVAYQQEINSNTTQTEELDYTDPLADTKSCKRDIEYLAKLNTNTIRVYAIDPEKDHDECMNALADAGIYVVADLSQPGLSINRDDGSWTTTLFQRYTDVVDVMAKYDNTLGFFAGNEVSNAVNNTFSSAFVKAAVRDTKAYIKSKNYRSIGVGYATNDDAEIRENLANYFDCGNKEDAIDFWGYNIYSWCGKSSFKESGFDVRTKEFEKYNVPVFFAEYGCNTPRPRLFTEVGTLYGSQMTGVWSGGIVYMYFEEANEFGLVSISGGSVKTNDDFDNLKEQIAKVNPTGVKMSEYSPTNTAAAECPDTGKDWEAPADPLPPVANSELCTCMEASLNCIVDDSNTKEDDYKDIFDFICSKKEGAFCAGINRNVTSGPYGSYGMCSDKEQLSFAINQYASNVTNGCDFKGQAKKQSGTEGSTQCKNLMAQAGPAGTGTVTSSPGTASGSGGSQGAAPGLSVPRFDSGLFGLGIYLVVAVLSGAAVIVL